MTNEYVYAALLIHKAGKAVDEATVKKVLEAAGAAVNDAQVKGLIASLEGKNIDEAIEKAAAAPVAAVAAPAAGGEAPAKGGEAKKDTKKEEKKTEEQAAAGLAALFG